ncbi:MAG: ribonuclease P protein component [Bacteroidales bacterium]|nr:ribonuclease P protein component [Bacteroidales bacterium]MDI3479102.1 ribonuclease protein component [Rikenellaceae bacterium]MDN5355532.1 ribonuclease protein component [Rikenellaceae bacterium]
MSDRLKKIRIISKKQKDKLFNQVPKLEYPFKIYHLIENGQGELHCLIAVSRKQFKKAVTRNRIRRVVRAVIFDIMDDVNAELQEKHQNLYIALVYIGDESPKYIIIKEKIIVFLHRLLNYEENKENTDSTIHTIN